MRLSLTLSGNFNCDGKLGFVIILVRSIFSEVLCAIRLNTAEKRRDVLIYQCLFNDSASKKPPVQKVLRAVRLTTPRLNVV